ncbi:hypothetical protein HHI36_006508 [Cryptolaemus montrouzieri]|uniref:MADF domain-containing protein n=1 Tax=Cryptolaemus montrouzieri TaxID=559131 RepID=A0ABD2NXL6_9CUCU
MDKMDINAELLISSVEKRPYLWDKSICDYKDKLKTNAAWKEVCAILREDFGSLSDPEKVTFGNDVVKRWNNIRDSFRKYLKQMKEKKSGQGAVKRKYVYYERLLFLKKLFDEQMKETLPAPKKPDIVNEIAEDSHAVQKSDITPATTSFSSQPPKKKKKLDDIEEKMLKALEESESPHLLFCKGILPSIKDFDEEETIDFQMGVLHLIKSIRNRRPNASLPTFSNDNVLYDGNNPLQNFQASLVESFPHKYSHSPDSASINAKREEEEYLSSPSSSQNSPLESKIFLDDVDFT